MVDYSKIENSELVSFIKASEKFSKLPVQEQQKQIDAIAGLPEGKQQEVLQFFVEEFEKEREENKQKLAALESLHLKIVEIEQRLKKLIRKETEDKDRNVDNKKMKSLLSKLNTN